MTLPVIPLGDPRIYIVQKLCEACGATYRAARSHQRWCTNCGPTMTRRYSATYMRERYASDPGVRERHAAWSKAHPEHMRAAQEKCYLWPCPECGKVRRVSLLGKEAKRAALCRQCSVRSRPKKRAYARCYWCEGVIERQPSQFKCARHWHAECHGEMTRASVVLGITRERMRQLVNKEQARLNLNGQHASRAEALASVIAQREKAHG